MERLMVDSLSKSFSGSIVIDQVSFQMDTGLMGLLGPNSSGKTTLLRLLATIIRPTSGTFKWMGVDCIQHPLFLKEKMGYVPQSFGLFPEMRALDFMVYMGSLKGIPRKKAREEGALILKELDLDPWDDRPLKAYSTGMKRRVGFAQALLGGPELFLLDEPTVALDPKERLHILEVIAKLAENRIVIMATHIPSDLYSASHIGILHRGRLKFFDEPEGLIDIARGRVWRVKGSAEDIKNLNPEVKVIHERRDKLEDPKVSTLVEAIVLSDEPPCGVAEAIESLLEYGYIAFMADINR